MGEEGSKKPLKNSRREMETEGDLGCRTAKRGPESVGSVGANRGSLQVTSNKQAKW